MKKLFAFGIFLLIVIACFISCSKEKSFETGIIPGQASIGTLKDDSGNCMIATPHGTWYNGVATTDSNYVEVQVNVKQKGTYVIYTDLQNGISLKDSGVFTNLGMNTVHLKPTGLAQNPGVTNFQLNYDTSICAFSLPIQDSTGSGQGSQAQFTLGDCANTTVFGKYVEGVALDATNKVALEVNVTTPGQYAITVNPANGVSFSKIGTFTATGVQEVQLDAAGTPTASGNINYKITVGSTTCGFNVNVLDAVNGNDAAWSFSEGGNNYHGYIDSTIIADSSTFKVLWVFGSTSATGDTAMIVGYPFDHSLTTPPPGTYNTKDGSYFGFYDKLNNNPLFGASKELAALANIEIDVSNYDASTRVLTGTFSGTAIGPTATYNITSGQFNTKVR